MEIDLITQEQYNTLLEIQNNNKILTYQNKGYDNFDKSKMSPEDKEAVNEIESILKKHIKGFSTFQNFKLSKKTNELEIRFQYNWGYDGKGIYFIGVGYLLVKELLKGFEK